MLYNLRRRVVKTVAQYQRLFESTLETPSTEFVGPCPCCGNRSFLQKNVLWDNLIDVWGLSQAEVSYINRQQGFRCTDCGARLRSMALASWLLHFSGLQCPLSEAVENSGFLNELSILEVNEAGQLTQFLRRLGHHELGVYPELDVQDMHYDDESFDIVIHSDTLEHVPDPSEAMRECRRVLKSSGICAFTVPTVVDRLSQQPVQRRISFHGHAEVRSDDLRVRTEFGSDVWKLVVGAGFREYRLYALEYPAGLVHIGLK